jgi:flagellar protein FlaG
MMSMEIPGILKSNPVPDVLIKEPRAAPERQQRPQPDAQLSRSEIEAQAKALERTFLAFNRRVKLSVNDEINQVIIKVVDEDTDRVIKEIPPEEIQHLIARIKETIGLLVDQKI